MKPKLKITMVLLLALLPFVLADMNSSNYKISSCIVSSGGSKTNSSSYSTDVVMGIPSGKMNSSQYSLEIGFWFSTGNTLKTPEPALSFVNGIDKTTSDLNCSAELISYKKDDKLNVSVRWYKNNTLSIVQYYNNSYSNGTLFNATLSSSQTSHNEIWYCSVRTYNGNSYSSWGDSNELTIANSLPSNVTLLNPTNNNDTLLDRTPLFTWTQAEDADNDVLTYIIKIQRINCSSPIGCSVAYIEDNTTNTYYEPSQSLDLDSWYNWSVTVYDGFNYSNESSVWNFSIMSTSIIAINNTVDFGNLTPKEENDTLDNNPNAFVIENNGNVEVNVTLKANDSLWSSVGLNTSYFKFLVNETDEKNAFDYANSQTSWANITSTSEKAIAALNYTANNTARIDIYVKSPSYEAPGNKTSTLIFEAEYYK